jgi:hypothetical protein
MREKFRVDKNVNEAKQIVCIGRTEMRSRKSSAKRKYRRRSNQILKQVDLENGDDISILDYQQELSGWDIA